MSCWYRRKKEGKLLQIRKYAAFFVEENLCYNLSINTAQVLYFLFRNFGMQGVCTRRRKHFSEILSPRDKVRLFFKARATTFGERWGVGGGGGGVAVQHSESNDPRGSPPSVRSFGDAALLLQKEKSPSVQSSCEKRFPWLGWRKQHPPHSNTKRIIHPSLSAFKAAEQPSTYEETKNDVEETKSSPL